MRAGLLVFALGMLVAATAARSQSRNETIGTDEIRPGMRGYGLTVFRGETPERFDVTVIDVLHNFRPDQDLILVRTDHPILDNASTVAGMSGSPIYLDGRLAGAYAYGWTFGKDPVAGVTPIASMHAELARPMRPVPAALRVGPQATTPAASPRAGIFSPFLGQTRITAESTLLAQATRFAPTTSPAGVRLASTPLLVGGLADDVVHMLTEKLERVGIVPLQAGGAAPRTQPPTATPPRFVDGGAIGVQLIRGDVNATGIGTVTHIVGDRLVAFGHPMMNGGQTSLPTATARVLHILANEERSFKIAEAVAPLGSIVNDRQPAIVVDTRAPGQFVPVTLRLHGVEGAPRTEWHMEVASHRTLTPMLVLGAILNAIRAAASDETDVIFTARTRVAIDGLGPVSVEDIGYAPLGLSDPGALVHMRLFGLLEAAYGNPFTETRVSDVQLDLDLRFVHDVTTIVDAETAADEVDPGSRVAVHVTLRPFGQPETLQTFELDIPEEAAGQTIELAFEAGDDVAIEQPIPRSLADLVEIVRTGYPATSLVISTKMPTRGLRLAGHVARSLPASALDTLSLANASRTGTTFATQARRVIELGHVLAGSARIRLAVRRTPRLE